MKLNNLVALFLIVLIHSVGVAQKPSARSGDFMFPVRPQQENYLSGTMGELRSTHFHSGLDIKTSGISGLPIYAAADGYIQRVAVSLGGYGNALYLVHPHNGTITVYAHLKSFDGAIAEYVRAQQYKEESFQVNLFPPKDRFVFKKGDVIALGGNSGSSSGPHLHFEVRNLSHRVLDPLDYGFDEIKDRLPPVLNKVAFVTMDEKSRVNGMYGRFEFTLQKDEQGNAYIKEGISLYGNIGVEVYAYDKFDGARNKNGIRFQKLIFDGKTVFEQDIEQINFSLTRNVLVHTNYQRSKEGGRRFNKLYVDTGNWLDFYETNQKAGILQIFDPLAHQIDIRLSDGYGNVSQFALAINHANFVRDRRFKNTYSLDKKGFNIYKNLLEVESDEVCESMFYLEDKTVVVPQTYYTNSTSNYIWNLNDGLPDSADVCGDMIRFGLSALIPSKQKVSWSNENFAIAFGKNALFDSAYLKFKYYESENYDEYFELDNVTTPLRQFVTINLKPKYEYDQQHANVYAVAGNGRLSYVGGEWEGNELVFKSRDLVKFTIASDTIAPTIVNKMGKRRQVKFKIADDRSGIHSMRATLDGKWLLMNFDAKSGLIWSDELIPLLGKFELAVKDNAGNISRFSAEY